MSYEEIIKNWGAAMEGVKNNSKIMCSNPTKEEYDECARTMIVLHAIEKKLFSFDPETVGIPIEMKNFIEADKDKDCHDEMCSGSCWFTSSLENVKPECGKKIDRWFKCRDALHKLFNEKYK